MRFLSWGFVCALCLRFFRFGFGAKQSRHGEHDSHGDLASSLEVADDSGDDEEDEVEEDSTIFVRDLCVRKLYTRQASWFGEFFGLISVKSVKYVILLLSVFLTIVIMILGHVHHRRCCVMFSSIKNREQIMNGTMSWVISHTFMRS